jgi:hypothetical protein
VARSLTDGERTTACERFRGLLRCGEEAAGYVARVDRAILGPIGVDGRRIYALKGDLRAVEDARNRLIVRPVACRRLSDRPR